MRALCLAATLIVWSAVASAQSAGVKLDGDQLRIAAPQLHFLGNEALQRLHSGIAVDYIFKVGLSLDRYGKLLNESTYRFVISYDIFEEKFAVSRLEPNPRSITHLSESAAEAWCFDSIALTTARIGADQAFWVALEYREEEAKSPTNSADSNATLMGQLIDIFSRKAQRQESRGSLTSGPFRLSELRKK